MDRKGATQEQLTRPSVRSWILKRGQISEQAKEILYREEQAVHRYVHSTHS